MALHRASPSILRPGVRRLDPFNKLNVGVKVALAMDGVGNGGDTHSLYDYARHQLLEYINFSDAALKGGIGPGGRMMYADSVNQRARYLNMTTDVLLGTSISAMTVALIRRKTDTTGRPCFSFCMNPAVSPDGANRCSAHLPYSNGNTYWDCGNLFGADRVVWGSYTPTTDIEYWALTAGPDGHYMYYNGALKANSANTTLYTPSSGHFFSINQDVSSGSSGDLQEFYQLHITTTQWGVDEIFSWLADPWQMYDDPFSWRKPRAAPAAGDTLFAQAVM